MDSEDEKNDDPKAAERSDNEENQWDANPELEEMLNNPENGPALDLHCFVNFPDLLDINKS